MVDESIKGADDCDGKDRGITEDAAIDSEGTPDLNNMDNSDVDPLLMDGDPDEPTDAKRNPIAKKFQWLSLKSMIITAGVVGVMAIGWLSGDDEKTTTESVETPVTSNKPVTLNVKSSTSEKETMQAVVSQHPLAPRAPRVPEVSKAPLQNNVSSLATADVDSDVRRLEIEARQREMAAKQLRYQAPGSLFERESPVSNTIVVKSTAKRLQHPETTLVQGEIISAILETAIDSQLVGNVKALVNQPVYAYTGNQALIPKGSRLIGNYQQAGDLTERRVFIQWTRIVRPDGVSLDINSPSTDRLGRTGQLANHVNTHPFARFGQAILFSLLSAGTEAVNGVDGAVSSNLSTAIQKSSSQLANTGKNILAENMDLLPTLHVHQGATLRIIAAEDVDFFEVLS